MSSRESAGRPLDGRCALITGASQGLGVAIARAYVKAGAEVLICARDAALLATARTHIAAAAVKPGQRVIARHADISRRADADELAATALEIFPQLDILVNNAGIHGPVGPAEDVEWDEWVETIAVNLFGSVLMCRAVLPHFKARRSGKIVQLSGGGATKPMPNASAYAASKAAVVRFVETLAEEVREYGIDVNAIAPGALNTRMLDEVLAAGPERAGGRFYDRAMQQKASGGESLEKGAALAVFLASSAGDGITGRLISAIWDPWERLDAHRHELLETDIYTLRRIVPADRGREWPER
jgi:NAD(P)-dependent dehydrogenase (short-subunit alcohol dehydrogenase family)